MLPAGALSGTRWSFPASSWRTGESPASACPSLLLSASGAVLHFVHQADSFAKATDMAIYLSHGPEALQYFKCHSKVSLEKIRMISFCAVYLHRPAAVRSVL